MRKRFILLLLPSLLVINAPAQDPLIAAARADLSAYEHVKLDDGHGPTHVRIQLGERTSVLGDSVMDGLRITAPADVADRDFVWYFNVPTEWSHWYILPVEGKPSRGFETWITPDRLYQGLDQPTEARRTRVLQTLEGRRLVPGADYILWFKRELPDDIASPELRAVVAFPPAARSWDHTKIETALALQESPLNDQIEGLDSRGGRILLDPDLFHPEDARSRIRSMLDSIRATMRTATGFFVTMESSTPPCRKQPAMADLRRKYGPADFVQTSEETQRVWDYTRGPEAGDEDDPPPPSVTHFYDYFGFVVAAGDPEERVNQVRVHAVNYSVLRPAQGVRRFSMLPMKHLATFTDDGAEVGRIYYFMEGPTLPLIITAPPPGHYRSADGYVLEYRGDGVWQLIHQQDGVVRLRVPFERHRIHGTMLEMDETGEVVRRHEFRDGNPQALQRESGERTLD